MVAPVMGDRRPGPSEKVLRKSTKIIARGRPGDKGFKKGGEQNLSLSPERRGRDLSLDSAAGGKGGNAEAVFCP